MIIDHDKTLNKGKALIDIQGLHKVFPDGTHALRGVDLQIRRGEGVILLGHNGSGKSTLMRCLTRLEQPSNGQMVFDGVDLARASRRQLRSARQRIGMVFQRFNLVGNLSAFQNVLFGALGRVGFVRCMSATASNELREEAMSCIERVGLLSKARARCDSLSGGQQQRIAIARTLMQRPEVVLADEPIASLDPRAGREVMELLWEVGKERQFTVLCTLHQLEIALNFGQRLVGLLQGRKVLDRPQEGLLEADLAWLYTNEQRDHDGADESHIVGCHQEQAKACEGAA